MLAGTTQNGGTLLTDVTTGLPVIGDAVGTVYKLGLDGSNYSEQCVFNTADSGLLGANPGGGVVESGDGFYGVTIPTGAIVNGLYGYGLIYKCGPEYTGPKSGLRPFVDTNGGGTLPMWLLIVLTAILGLRLLRRPPVLSSLVIH
jgi:hypothetical protein